jgi:hypothetical protein
MCILLVKIMPQTIVDFAQLCKIFPSEHFFSLLNSIIRSLIILSGFVLSFSHLFTVAKLTFNSRARAYCVIFNSSRTCFTASANVMSGHLYSIYYTIVYKLLQVSQRLNLIFSWNFHTDNIYSFSTGIRYYRCRAADL